jgi:hypothetical protein
MTEYDNIHLRPHQYNSGFSYDLNILNAETPEIIVYCEDREHDLINGLVHEITEATINMTIRQLENNRFFMIDTKDFRFSLSHLLTVYSMEYYSKQFQHMLFYESLFKMRMSITRSVRP